MTEHSDAALVVDGLTKSYGDRVALDGITLDGGLILEISLTTRLTLMARGDWTTARTAPDGTSWADTALITGGLAICWCSRRFGPCFSDHRQRVPVSTASR